MDPTSSTATNAEETAVTNTSLDDLLQRRQELEDLMSVIATEVARDGGTARLGEVDYQEGHVEVVLAGACGSCTLTGATLEAGIERILRQRLSWVTSFRGTVEETAGAVGAGNWRPRL